MTHDVRPGAKKRDVVEDRHIAAPYAGQDQQVLCPTREFGRHHHTVGFGLQEQNKELRLDRIDRNAAVANRPLDESVDFILGIVEQELVPRTQGNICESGEGIAGRRVIICRQPVYLPSRLKKKTADPLELLG